MRLSLRTLLAFEDNVFDVEQHRRLEQLLPTDKNAEATLQRMRSVVRNPALGVPGLVDQQEELDPNYVAEYLDHQMPGNVQDKFESYCLSADKYLAEIASVHHILSNVLGEPARTSRECRIKCYDVLSAKERPTIGTGGAAAGSRGQPTHFRPYEAAQKSPPVKAATFWSRWFPAKSVPQAPVEQKKSSPTWTFTVIGMCVCILLLGWQQIEKQRFTQQLRNVTDMETTALDGFVNEKETDMLDTPLVTDQQPGVAEQAVFIAALNPLAPLEPIEQAFYAAETTPYSVDAVAEDSEIPEEDPFAIVAEMPPIEKIIGPDPPPIAFEKEEPPFGKGEIPSDDLPNDTAPADDIEQTTVAEIIDSQEPLTMPDESVIAFQPIISSVKTPPDMPDHRRSQVPLPVTDSSPDEVPDIFMPVAAASAQHPPPVHPPVVPTPEAHPKILGRVLTMIHPSVVFSAVSVRDPWQLPPLPFDLHDGQYLLTAAPFRGTFELAAGFRIEMIGDAKLCLLPPDATGVPGIFVDYGRIIVYPLEPNRPLRIEMEKARGIVSVAGTDSVLFVDTFAEISDPPGSTKLPEEQKKRTSPILGFVPKNGERIVWHSVNQPQPFYVDRQGSVLLQSDQYRFGDIQHLPNWLGPMPMSQEDRILAETCRRCFADAGGNGEQALTWLIQDESRSVRTLGLRLWGDLGRFDVPVRVMAERQKEDESVRLVLVRYFEEVMRRDAETIQRFSDAIEIAKEARR